MWSSDMGRLMDWCHKNFRNDVSLLMVEVKKCRRKQKFIFALDDHEREKISSTCRQSSRSYSFFEISLILGKIVLKPDCLKKRFSLFWKSATSLIIIVFEHQLEGLVRNMKLYWPQCIHFNLIISLYIILEKLVFSLDAAEVCNAKYSILPWLCIEKKEKILNIFIKWIRSVYLCCYCDFTLKEAKTVSYSTWTSIILLFLIFHEKIFAL